MINTIIIDDEPLALDVLETYISKMPEFNLVARCTNALEANEILRKQPPIDLIFLDIQMPQISGVEFIKALEKPPMFIFTTAYSNYALEGYELNAIDYLLKPISIDRFMKAANKALSQYELRRREESAVDTHPGTEGEDFFFVKADKKLVKIKYDEILYIEGLKDYVIIRLEQGRVVTLQTMKSLEDKLPLNKFKRIHRSYIVSIDKIHAVDGTSVDVYEKGQIKQLPIGKNYRDEILEIVNRNKL